MYKSLIMFIFVGEKLVADRFTIVIDHTVVNESLSSMLEAVILLVTSYYCFNIQYPGSLAATLEFIQRYIIQHISCMIMPYN